MNKRISFSFTANGSHSCSGFCRYCSAARQMEYDMGVKGITGTIDEKKLLASVEEVDEKSYSEFVFDREACAKAFDNDPQVKPVLENRDKYDRVDFHCDLWCADPLTSLCCIRDMTEFLENYCKERGFECHISTSTNGLPIIRDEACDFLREHHMTLQISHDGLGQWIRTNDIDPMDFPNAKALMREGVLNAVNTTLNFWNSTIFGNHSYWVGKLKEIFPEIYAGNCKDQSLIRSYNGLYIKLNHIYDGQYDIKAQNTKGLFNGKEYEQLKGVPLGNLNFRDDKEMAKLYNMPELGWVLSDYMNEYKHFGIIMLDPNLNTRPEYKPFKSYIDGQINRFKYQKDHDYSNGACRAFQRYKHNIGDPEVNKKHSTTFVLDTTGRYSECNLIDADTSVSNPGGVQPSYCKGCKYEFAQECNPCGSEKFATECNYYYRWEQLLQEFMWIQQVINNNKRYAVKQEQQRIYNNIFGNPNCNCSNNNKR